MFEHRRKTIGKSLYYISEHNGKYAIKEIYNNELVGSDKKHYNRIDEALEALVLIDREQYYTDAFHSGNFNI